MDFAHPLRVVSPTLDGDVLAVLAGADDEFSGRRIHRVMGHGSEPGVRKAVERLVDQGVVLRSQAGRANLYRLNRLHLAAAAIESLAAARAELTARLREAIAGWKHPPLCAVLFGSAARAEQFLDVAETIRGFADDEADIGDAFVTFCIHAGIAASDTICCEALGHYVQGDDHNQAITELSKVRPNGGDLGNDLRALLQMKKPGRVWGVA
jgi:hypothetical protein